MNNQKHKIDLDLVLANFHDLVAGTAEHEANPQQASEMLQELLLDRLNCEARVGVLRCHPLGKKYDRKEIPPPSDELLKVVDAIVRLGAIGAYLEGEVQPRDLARVAHDPGALWHAHIGFTNSLMSDELDPAYPEASGALTEAIFQENWSELAERLSWVAPRLTRSLSLDESHQQPLMKFLVEKAQEGLQGQRFRDLLPSWLVSYGQEHQLPALIPPSLEQWRQILFQSALDRAIEKQRQAMDSLQQNAGKLKAWLPALNELLSIDELSHTPVPAELVNNSAAESLRRAIINHTALMFEELSQTLGV